MGGKVKAAPEWKTVFFAPLRETAFSRQAAKAQR
jgi:hypothetical protein